MSLPPNRSWRNKSNQLICAKKIILKQGNHLPRDKCAINTPDAINMTYPIIFTDADVCKALVVQISLIETLMSKYKVWPNQQDQLANIKFYIK